MSTKKHINVVVLCHNSEGRPEFHSCSVEATQSEIDEGKHLEDAKENAEHNGYSAPMIAFDKSDAAASQMASLSSWL